MTTDLQQEFALLSAKAKQRLKDVAESGSFRHVFSFWTMPSFSPPCRCTLYSPLSFAKGKQPFAEFAIWRSDLDLEKLRTPVERLKYPKELMPTIQDDVVWLTGDEVEAIEQRIRGISIPFFLAPPSVVGCDGTSFEFHYDQIFFGASLHWWEGYPNEWRPFIEVVMDIGKNLDARRASKNQENTPKE